MKEFIHLFFLVMGVNYFLILVAFIFDDTVKSFKKYRRKSKQKKVKKEMIIGFEAVD